MTKKVITRRQRKAAEAKRQSQEKVRGSTSESQNGNLAAPAVINPDVQPSGSNLVGSPPIGGQAKPNAPAISQAAEADKPKKGKSKLTIVVKDTVQIFGDENVQTNTTNTNPGEMQPPTAPINQGSFSKALTRRAAATFTKIQRLSKVFNKKMNYKQPRLDLKDTSPNETDANMNGCFTPVLDQSKSCSCEFCKAVLGQLLTRKKRTNKKKIGKNSSKLPASRRSITPECKSATQDSSPKCEECKLKPPTGATKRKVVHMLEKKEKQLEKDVLKKINQIEKKKKTKVVKDNNMPKKNDEAKPQMNKPAPVKKPNLSTTPKKTLKTEKSKCPPITEGANSTTTMTKSKPTKPKSLSEPKPSVKTDFLCAIQQLSVAPVTTAPVKVLGNTGYFVLTGTDAQLAAQLKDLAAKKVNVTNCVVLEPGMTDKLEQQLEELDKNRELILKQMHDKHDMMAPRRQKRTKEPHKYN